MAENWHRQGVSREFLVDLWMRLRRFLDKTGVAGDISLLLFGWLLIEAHQLGCDWLRVDIVQLVCAVGMYRILRDIASGICQQHNRLGQAYSSGMEMSRSLPGSSVVHFDRLALG